MKALAEELRTQIERAGDGDLDDRLLGQFVEMAAERSNYPRPEDAEVTSEVKKEARKFEKDLKKVLVDWVKKHPLREQYTADDLYDKEGSYIVLMTLRGEGVGIWDGRWDHFFNDSDKDIKALEKELDRKLRKYADDSGGGSLEDAFSNAAYDLCGGAEMDEDRNLEEAKAGTVGVFLAIVSHNLTRYDMQASAREAKRGPVNIYRLGHLMKALGEVQGDVKALKKKDDPESLDKLKASLNKRFVPGFAPIKKTIKQIDAFLEKGKLPRLK